VDLDVGVIPELPSVLLLITVRFHRLQWRLPKFLFLVNRYAISPMIVYVTSFYLLAVPLAHQTVVD
jgi:hypothetical protein